MRVCSRGGGTSAIVRGIEKKEDEERGRLGGDRDGDKSTKAPAVVTAAEEVEEESPTLSTTALTQEEMKAAAAAAALSPGAAVATVTVATVEAAAEDALTQLINIICSSSKTDKSSSFSEDKKSVKTALGNYIKYSINIAKEEHKGGAYPSDMSLSLSNSTIHSITPSSTIINQNTSNDLSSFNSSQVSSLGTRSRTKTRKYILNGGNGDGSQEYAAASNNLKSALEELERESMELQLLQEYNKHYHII